MGLTPHHHLECRGLRKGRAIPLLTLRVFMAYKKDENLPTICSLCLGLLGCLHKKGHNGQLKPQARNKKKTLQTVTQKIS